MYWERRYAHGGDSGAGSRGRLAQFKAEVLNAFVAESQVQSVIEFGCGDGQQLSLARYPRYIGLDPSREAIRRCIATFNGDETKSFYLYDSQAFLDREILRADLALSLDVIYHLVEDDIFESYMQHLFEAAQRFVIIYSSDFEGAVVEPHIRRRAIRPWIAEHQPSWQLRRVVANPYQHEANNPATSFSDFFIYAYEQGSRATVPS